MRKVTGVLAAVIYTAFILFVLVVLLLLLVQFNFSNLETEAVVKGLSSWTVLGFAIYFIKRIWKDALHPKEKPDDSEIVEQVEKWSK